MIGIRYSVDTDITGLIAVRKAILDDIGKGVAGAQRLIRRIMGELCRIEPKADLAVRDRKGNVFTAVFTVHLVLACLNQRIGTVNVVFVDAGTKSHFTVIGAAVRLQEGQRCVGYSAHVQVVAGIKQQRRIVVFSAHQIAGVYRADIDVAVHVRHRRNRALDPLRLINCQLAFLVGRQAPLFAGSVGIGYGGLRLRSETEQIKLVLKSICLYGKGFTLSCVGMGCGDGNIIIILSLSGQQEIGCRGIGGVRVASDIGVITALFVVYGNTVGVAGTPLHLIRQQAPDTRAVVG